MAEVDGLPEWLVLQNALQGGTDISRHYRPCRFYRVHSKDFICRLLRHIGRNYYFGLSLMNYNPKIDGLRCIAILFVFINHVVPHSGEIAPFLGSAGVDLFFVISGFLITSILLASEGSFGDAYKRFIGRRTLRIFPVYYLTIFALFLLDSSLKGRMPYLLTYSYIYAPDFKIDYLSPLWSLCVEEQFYLLWPFLVLSCRRNTNLLLGITLLLAFVCGCQLLFQFVPISPLHFITWPFPRGFGLLLGSAGAILYRQNRLPKMLSGKWVGNIALLSLIALSFIDSSVTFTLIPVASFVVVMNTTGRRFGGWLQNKPMVYTGMISYGFYLFHKPVGHWMQQTAVPWLWQRLPFENMGYLGKIKYNPWLKDWIASGLSFLLILSLAALSYRFFEKPILALKDEWFPNRKKINFQYVKELNRAGY